MLGQFEVGVVGGVVEIECFVGWFVVYCFDGELGQGVWEVGYVEIFVVVMEFDVF